MIQIRNRWTDEVIHEGEYASIKDAVLGALKARAYLYGANLSRANLSGANLSRANLYGADLSRANLSRANLSGANLSRANLSGANLSRANLSGADLSRANLYGADLEPIKADVWMVLTLAMPDVPYLLQAMREGKIDGSTYRDCESGCACLVGTLAVHRGCSEHDIPGLKPNADRPAERWFLRFRPGMTPDSDPAMKITEEWITEFMAIRGMKEEVTA